MKAVEGRKCSTKHLHMQPIVLGAESPGVGKPALTTFLKVSLTPGTDGTASLEFPVAASIALHEAQPLIL